MSTSDNQHHVLRFRPGEPGFFLDFLAACRERGLTYQVERSDSYFLVEFWIGG